MKPSTQSERGSELLRKWSAPFRDDPNDVLALMASLGYGCWAVGPQGNRRLVEVTDITPETNDAFLRHEVNALTITGLVQGPEAA